MILPFGKGGWGLYNHKEPSVTGSRGDSRGLVTGGQRRGEKMDEEKVQALLDLLLLPVADRPDLKNYDASFDRLELVGRLARIMGAGEELGEALRRKVSIATARDG